MGRRFVITGPPGSGKTPLIEHLRTMGSIGVEEPARAVLAEQRAIGVDRIFDTDPQRFVDLMLARAIEDFERTATSDRRVFFDRGIPDHIGYAKLFGLDTSAAQRAALTCRYDDPVFALPSWPEIYTTDGDRRMTVEHAAAFGEHVREVYVDLDYTVVDVPIGDIPSRAAFVRDAVGS